MTLGDLKDFQLVVALVSAAFSPLTGNGPVQTLHPWDLVWFANGGASPIFRNNGKTEAPFIGFAFSIT